MVIASCAQAPLVDITPLRTFQDKLADGSLGPVMIVIPAGEFSMGPVSIENSKINNELPSHTVTVKRPFAIGKFELTFKEYDQFVNATRYERPSDQGWGKEYWGRNKTPVFNVSWNDAQRYLKWLSEQTGAHYRLPSEAEWEYVARAGSENVFHSGNCIATDQANFHGKETYLDCPATGQYLGKVTDIGSYPANAWGLHDAHGNIFEWTQDCWHENYTHAPTDGSTWLDQEDNAQCDLRVIRGGSWSGRAIDIRAAARARNFRNHKSIFIGFRVARDLN